MPTMMKVVRGRGLVRVLLGKIKYPQNVVVLNCVLLIELNNIEGEGP